MKQPEEKAETNLIEKQKEIVRILNILMDFI